MRPRYGSETEAVTAAEPVTEPVTESVMRRSSRTGNFQTAR